MKQHCSIQLATSENKSYFCVVENFSKNTNDLHGICIETFLMKVGRNGILLPKLFWPTLKKNVLVIKKNFLEIWGCRPTICKNFDITWTIHSNSELSEQFLVTECFFNLFLEVSQISKNWTIIIQIGKSYWDLEICRKS